MTAKWLGPLALALALPAVGLWADDPSKKQIERELAILNTAPYQESRDDVVWYVQQLQRARSASDVCRLQRALITDVNLRQKALIEFVAEHEPPAKARFAQLVKQEPKPE